MTPTVSVLVPSRKRVELLHTSARSLLETAAEPATVEILVAADPDDQSTTAYAVSYGFEGFVSGERYGYSRLHEYVNRLAEQATGDWLLLWNDDAVMTTPGWDTLLREQPHPAMLMTKSNFFDKSLCLFPIVSRVIVEAMGHFSLSPHNDTWITDVCTQVGVVRPVDIFVQHNRFDETGLNDDETYRESKAGYRSSDYYSAAMAAQRDVDATKIREALGL